jgi:hypothetical protein
MNNSNSRYNSPMVDLKKWYKNVILDAGHLTSMKDPELQRMYASTVVNSMDHLSHALDEKINMVEEADRRRDLTSMKNAVVRSMEHVKKDFTITGPPYVKYPWKNDNSNARATLAQIQQTLANSIARVNTATVEAANTAAANTVALANTVAAANTAATNMLNTEALSANGAISAESLAAANNAAAEAAEAATTDENAFSLSAASNNNAASTNTAESNNTTAPKNKNNNTAAQGGRRRANKKRATRKNKNSRRQAMKSRRNYR